MENQKIKIEKKIAAIYKDSGYDKQATEKTWFIMDIKRLYKEVKITVTPYFSNPKGDIKVFFGSGRTEQEALNELEENLNK
jgi:hypothetical protein